MELEKHYTIRSGWLRATVLGANDGILSTTSLVIGVVAASDTRSPVILAALAGLVAGALSMNEISQPKPLQALRVFACKILSSTRYSNLPTDDNHLENV